MLSTTVATLARFQYVDYPTSYYEGPFSCIVPYPKEKLNLLASLKPLSHQVYTYALLNGSQKIYIDKMPYFFLFFIIFC